MIERRRMMLEQGELPSGYKRCKYLESNAKQYISVPYYPKVGDTGSITFQFTNPGRIGFAIGSMDTGFVGFQVGLNNYAFYSNAAGTFSQSDTAKKTTFVCSRVYSASGLTTYLFGRNFYGTAGMDAVKIFDCTMNRDGNAIINLIPCIDKNSTPCMYDTVLKQSFYNQGQGKFGYELMDGTYVAPV